MKEAITKFKNSGFIKALQRYLYSKIFPFVSAFITLICYYLGWDIVLFYYIAVFGILIFLLADDVSPVISLLLFMCVSISLKNTPSPSMGDSDYYFRPEIYIQIFIIIIAFASTAVYRLINSVAKKKFTITPVFYGLCAFSAVLILNGAFSDNYNPKNLLYGIIMAACFLGIFSVLKDNLKMNGESYERIAYSFLSLSVLLIIELIVAYATTEGLIENGDINRGLLIFGWGVYNTYGVLLVMCIPATIFLAGKKKFGFVFTLYSVFLFIAVFFSCSRQAMVGAAVAYPCCLIALFLKGKNKIANLCIVVAALIAGIILFAIYKDNVIKFFKDIFDNMIVDGELNGSGRMRLWREAYNNYKNYPLLGAGFYVKFSYTAQSGLGFIPYMCHNTVLQLLSSCGTIGLIAYLVHRIQTIKSFLKNVTVERTFIAATILTLLIVCLFDNHIFNIFPTIVYASLIAVLVQNENKKYDKSNAE